MSAAKKVEAEKAKQEAQVELSRLKDDLDVSEKEVRSSLDAGVRCRYVHKY